MRVIGGSLRGAGDTRFPLMATMFSLIGMRCGLAAIATYMGLPVVWVYAALVGDYLVKASMLIWRFQRGRWKTIGQILLAWVITLPVAAALAALAAWVLSP